MRRIRLVLLISASLLSAQAVQVSCSVLLGVFTALDSALLFLFLAQLGVGVGNDRLDDQVAHRSRRGSEVGKGRFSLDIGDDDGGADVEALHGADEIRSGRTPPQRRRRGRTFRNGDRVVDGREGGDAPNEREGARRRRVRGVGAEIVIDDRRRGFSVGRRQRRFDTDRLGRRRRVVETQKVGRVRSDREGLC